jgi:hypothetical protein
MHKHFAHLHARTLLWHHFILELLFVIGLLAFVIAPSVSAAKRLQERSLYMNSTNGGDATFYRLSFRYMSPDPIGSFELLFCEDPIPYHPCDKPPGLDVGSVTLGMQTGETGFAITQQSTNRLVLSRAAVAPVSLSQSSYVLDGAVNPDYTGSAFAIRIKTFTSTDATGPQIDFGSVRGQITEGIVIQTQVPPMLIFCLAQEVQYNCINTNEVYYTDMGELSPEDTLTAQSQMAVGTNATAGFSILAYGASMSAGNNVIPALDQPTLSQAGENQFGINLVANTAPTVGADPEGVWANAVAASDYSQPDHYKFISGDEVAYSPNVSLMKKFTVSYIVNASPSLKAGVYTTTVNFIATGRF